MPRSRRRQRSAPRRQSGARRSGARRGARRSRPERAAGADAAAQAERARRSSCARSTRRADGAACRPRSPPPIARAALAATRRAAAREPPAAGARRPRSAPPAPRGARVRIARAGRRSARPAAPPARGADASGPAAGALRRRRRALRDDAPAAAARRAPAARDRPRDRVRLRRRASSPRQRRRPGGAARRADARSTRGRTSDSTASAAGTRSSGRSRGRVGAGLRALYVDARRARRQAALGRQDAAASRLHAAIAAALPEARFIHLIRDGRDVAASVRDLPFAPGDGSIEAIARDWRDQILPRAPTRAALAHYREVRYERLVTEPEPVLRELCDVPRARTSTRRCCARTSAPPHGLRAAARSAGRGGAVTATRAERIARHAHLQRPPDPARVGTLARRRSRADEVARFESTRPASCSPSSATQCDARGARASDRAPNLWLGEDVRIGEPTCGSASTSSSTPGRSSRTASGAGRRRARQGARAGRALVGAARRSPAAGRRGRRDDLHRRGASSPARAIGAGAIVGDQAHVREGASDRRADRRRAWQRDRAGRGASARGCASRRTPGSRAGSSSRTTSSSAPAS